jgi:hypothetical protein
MNAYEHFDEDVENNFNEDVIPDVLNPYIDSNFVTPVTRTTTPVQLVPLNIMPQSAPKMRSRPVATKKKMFLTVNTFTSQLISV